jgi:hypothetical protein
MNVYQSVRHPTLEFKNLRQDVCWDLFAFVGFCLLNFLCGALCKVMWTMCTEANFLEMTDAVIQS